jgi:hypothetical protein
VQWPKLLNAGLEEVDPELYDIIEHEKNRQYKVCSASQATCVCWRVVHVSIRKNVGVGLR